MSTTNFLNNWKVMPCERTATFITHRGLTPVPMTLVFINIVCIHQAAAVFVVP